MSNKYLEYIKDNPKGLWFKRKLFGWGWTPVKWQGWVVVAIFITYLLWNGFSIDKYAEPTNKQLMWFLGKIIVGVAILFVICYKTGEKPRWQWGLPKKDGISNQDK